ncbi:hypothetical protein GCM10022293_07060 [Azospirillum formosense]
MELVAFGLAFGSSTPRLPDAPPPEMLLPEPPLFIPLPLVPPLSMPEQAARSIAADAAIIRLRMTHSLR